MLNQQHSATTIKLVECPRDAMQGWKPFIPTEKKIKYLNALLKVGFDTLDFGSFVSPKAIPQLADTKEVVKKLDLSNGTTKLLAIIANLRGAEEAVVYDEIAYLGFPFSISETFQRRNTNKSIQEAFETVEELQNLCVKNRKKLVVYISMGFGNPYGDPYHEEIVEREIDNLIMAGVNILAIADTVGLATPQQVAAVMKVCKRFPNVEIGVHLHSTKENWKEKLDAALDAGCMRFDGALKGIGGCPMANDALVGNMDTELMIPYFTEKNLLSDINKEALTECSKLAAEIFVKC